MLGHLELLMGTSKAARPLQHELRRIYNEGERVLGTATPLFTLFLSLFAFVRLGAGWGALLVSGLGALPATSATAG